LSQALQTAAKTGMLQCYNHWLFFFVFWLSEALLQWYALIMPKSNPGYNFLAVLQWQQ